MCGISFTNKPGINTAGSHFLELRGPDGSKTVQVDDFKMTHYLLSMTGDVLLQPLQDGDITCLFNGEIYNYKDFGDFPSDVFSIVESYKKHKDNFVKKLDGEFAIILLDKQEDILYVSCDTFGIKPLYYSIENTHIGVSSYKSVIQSWGFKDIKRVLPNTTLKFKASTLELLGQATVHDFSLEQNVDSYQLWHQAFEIAIKKRFLNTDHQIILPLSSGMDSGAIACALDKFKAEYCTYSFTTNEDTQTIHRRINSAQSFDKITHNQITSSEEQIICKHYSKNTEPFFYGPDFDHLTQDGFSDPGGKGLTHLLHEIKKKHPRVRILASGQGGDEITTNLQTYKFGTPNPSVFPKKLEKVFPWENFYYGANSSYLAKEEAITGSFGVEGRYPFLDTNVVQAFLNISPRLKNRSNKAPIWNYLEENNYHRQHIKHGFNPG
jgi:asparagine synthetase B (glutamine-hydrolysing)